MPFGPWHARLDGTSLRCTQEKNMAKKSKGLKKGKKLSSAKALRQ